MNWAIVAVLIQLFETLVVIFAVWYTWQQVKAMRHDVQLGAVWDIFKEMDNDEMRFSRGYVYKNRLLYKNFENKKINSKGIPKKAWKHAQRVSTTLDHLGYMVNKGLVPKNLIWDGYRYIIARNWIVLEPFIKFIRQERQQYSYQAYFEELAIEIFRNHIKREEIQFTDEPYYFEASDLKTKQKPNRKEQQ